MRLKARSTVVYSSLAAVALLSSCHSRVCTMDLRTGLAVRLSNARTGEPLCVGTVVAIDGDFRETLNNSNCAFFGAHERPGSYRLEALAEGFVPAVREGVVVDADECHVIRTDLTIPLEPDPNAPADGGIESGP